MQARILPRDMISLLIISYDQASRLITPFKKLEMFTKTYASTKYVYSNKKYIYKCVIFSSKQSSNYT